MSRFLRFFRVIGVIIACVFGAIAPRVGYADTTYPFTVTTTALSANTAFTFTISARGTFYVDWGDGSAEQTISHSNTSEMAISHTYTNAGTYTIGLRGTAGIYNEDPLVAAISFGAYDGHGQPTSNTADLVAGISGSLGALFPHVRSAGIWNNALTPSFAGTFWGCSSLSSIVSGEGVFYPFQSYYINYMFNKMFYRTFYGCTGLTEVPGNLFYGFFTGNAGSVWLEGMFEETFAYSGLTYLPEGLFGEISGTGTDMFKGTFQGCSNLGGYVPKGMFWFDYDGYCTNCGLRYNANNNMMTDIFDGTNLATSCDPYGAIQYTSDFDSYFDGKVVCQPGVNVTFSCVMPTDVPRFVIGYGTAPSSISVPITSGNVTFTFPDGANCNDSNGYGTKLNAWTCDAAICNNRTWSSDGTAVFNEPWDGLPELNFHMVYEPAVFSVSLDKNRYYYDNQVDTSPVAGNVTTLYEKYGVGWSTSPNGPFSPTLTLSASDLPTANGFEFAGYYGSDNGATDYNFDRLCVDATGRVVGQPIFENNLYTAWVPQNVGFAENVILRCGLDGDLGLSDFSDCYVDDGGTFSTDVCNFAQNFSGTSTFNQGDSYGYSATVQYGDNIVVPSKNACERQGYYYNQWVVLPWGNRITAGNGNTNYTWNHYGGERDAYLMFNTSIIPVWQRIETTITLNPQNGNLGGGTTALYTVAANQDDNSASGVYLDSARTELMTANTNPIAAPTAPTATTLTFNLNDSVSAPASLSYTPKSYSYYDGTTTVSQTCGQRYGITISNDGKTFTVPAQFNGYYSAASGGTQYVEKREALGTNFYFITQAGIDAGLAYSTDTTWYGQWERIDPIDACVSGSMSVSRPGYTFDGWWTAASGGTQVTNFAIGQNTTVYAHWAAVTYTITLNKNNVDAVDGNVTTVYEKYSVGWATTNTAQTAFGNITLTGNQLPTRTGYALIGFYDAAENGNAVGTFSNGTWTPPSSTTYTAGATLYAQWTPATYNITYNYQGGSNTSALPAGYTQVKYIISSQKIPLGFYTNQDSEIEARWTRVATASQYIYQANSGSSLTNNTTAYVSSSGGNWRFGNKAFSLTPAVGSEIVSVQNKNGVKFNGETVGTYTGVNNFAGNVEFGALGVGSGSIQLSYIKHRQNGVLLGNYVACQRNSDSAVGLCDLVSGVFYTNADATITAGSAVTTPYPATYTYGVGATVYGLPSRANSIFESWCRTYDSTNNTYSDCAFPHEINITDLGNKNMYAKWVCKPNYHLNGTGANETCEPDVYAITLDKNANDAVDGVTTVYEQYGIGWAPTNTAQTAFGNITLTGNQLPTRTGYALIGFYDAAENGNAVGTFSNGAWTPPAANTYTAAATLYAQWTLQTYNATFTCRPSDSVYNALVYMGISDANMYEQLAPVATMNLQGGQSFTAPSLANCALTSTVTDTGWFSNVQGNGARWTRNGADSYTPGQAYEYRSYWGNTTFNPVYTSNSFGVRYYCNRNAQQAASTTNVSALLNNGVPGYESVVVPGVGNGDGQVNCSQPTGATGFVGWFADSSGNTLYGKTFTSGALIGQYNDVTAFPAQSIHFIAVWDCDTANTGYVYDMDTGQCVPGVYAITLDKNANDAVDGVTTVYEQYGIGWATTNTDQTTFGALALSGNQLPTRPGYTFAGYADAATNGNAVGTFGNGTWTAPVATTYNAAATLYAQWTVATYNITYNYNGGTVGSSALPAGYTRVEYIESDGSQYINTNVLGLNKRIVIDAQYTGTATAVKVLAGYSSSYNGTMISSYNRKWGVGSSNSTQTSVASTNRTLISAVLDADSNGYNRATLTANGETVAYTRTESGGIRDDANLRLFGANGTSSYGFIGRIYGVTIYDNNTGSVLFNGIPAKNSSNVIGIYDTVRGTFLENVGSGSFTDGNAVTVPYPATYTYGTGAMVYGMPAAPLNNVFTGWCRDSALTTGCGMPHEITATEYGDKTLYAKYDCVYGYSRNAQTGQCEIDAPFTVTIKVPANAATEFKFNIAAKGTFVVDWGDGSQGQVITRTGVSNVEYTHTYAAVAGAGVEDTQTFDIKIAGLATGYSGDSSSGAIRFYNGTPDSNGGLGTGAVDGTEVYIDHISGSLGAVFPTVGAGDSGNTVPHFYQTFMNAKNMTQTMSSLVNLFDGVNGTSGYMFNFTFYNCKKLTGSIPADLFGRVKNGVYSGIEGAPASHMFRETFYGCSGLTGSIPENLFGRVVNGTYYGINGAPASYMFLGTFRSCSGLTGSIPGNLFGRVVNGTYYGINGTPASNMFYTTFYGCSGLTGNIPENLFVGINGAPASYMFYNTFRNCSGLTGTIPENLFVGINGAPASHMFDATFYGCSGLTGPIPGNLFGRVVNNEFVGISGAPKTYMFASTFLNCTGLTGSIPATLFGRAVNGTYYGISGTPASYMFYRTFDGDQYLTGEIPSYLFGHLSGDAKEGMFNRTFYNCRGLTGTIPGNLFGGTDLTGPGVTNMFVQAFYNCTNLSGYVPENLFGGTVYPTTDQGNMVQSVFYNTGLATSCPCGTIDVTTNSPWYTYWNSRVSCRVGLDTGQHWYNGQCTTMCSNSSIDELHVGSLSAFPILADKITTPSINVKLGNTQCYVPLATGNGGTNSFNMSYDGNVYHADRPDDITPVGFGQRD